MSGGDRSEKTVPATALRSDVGLGPLLAAHAEATLRWLQDPEVSRNLGLHRQPSMAATLDWITAVTSNETGRAFAILRNGQHVGNVVLDQIDPHLGTGRLFIYVGEPDARGGGVGRSATILALALAFGALGLHKVWLIVHARNLAAISTYITVGFALEGVLRDEFLLDGERLPAWRMGFCRGDWDRLRVRAGLA